MKILTKLFFLLLFTSSPVWSDINDAVVKIYTVYNRYNYYEPWQMVGIGKSSGSGCVISGNRILSNAHVVKNQTFIQVKRAGKAKKYTAEVEIVAHECDLAILKVNDKSFFADVTPIKIGDLAEVRDEVAVYGFPKGGDELCITEGVVSRVEHNEYSHSSAYLLTCQIDAAINSGSSGGPVIKNDRIVGVAFQGLSGENIGYMVPAPIIKHFLKDIEDGIYDGIPGIGITWQEMENPDIRLKYSMFEEQSGILVNKVYPNSPATGIIKPDDIILSINGQDIANNGTIKFRKDERTSYVYLLQKKYINDTIKMKVLREKELIDLDIILSRPINYCRLVPYQIYDTAPTYYISGGLVFEPLTRNFLAEWGKSWYKKASVHLVNYYYNGEPTDERSEIIVLVKVLADEINVGYHDCIFYVISRVNGNKISDIKDLVKSFEENNGEYHIIEDETGLKIILEKDKVDKYSQRILDKYKINSDRSPDLENNPNP